MRAVLKYNPAENMIQATELPYGVFTNTIMDQLAELTQKDPDYGIDNATDHTKKVADIRIYLSKGVNPNKMIAKLYHDTSLENWFSVNMVLLDKGRFPKIFGWKEACNAYIEHIRICETNILQYDLDKLLARKNIVEGLIKACSIIDEIIALIRASANATEASNALCSTYGFNIEQSKAILAIKLSNLTKLDIVKLNDELSEIIKEIDRLSYILNDTTVLDDELIKILQEVANTFGDARRTQILNILGEEEEPEEIKEQEIAILINKSYITLKEKEDAKKNKDYIYATNLERLLIFTNYGKMYSLPLTLSFNRQYDIKILLGLAADENILLMISSSNFNSYKSLITVTNSGYIKKSSIKEYSTLSKKGIPITKLETGEKLVGLYLSFSDKEKVVVISSDNYYNCYPISTITDTGRITKGVKAIKLNEKEQVQSTYCIEENEIEYNGKLIKLIETKRAVKGKVIE